MRRTIGRRNVPQEGRSEMPGSARKVIEAYNDVVWNEGDITLAGELLGDTVVRHEVGGATTLTHEQAVQRVVDTRARYASIWLELPLVIAGDDGEFVAVAYDMATVSHDGARSDIGSMEIFRVVDGRICEVWNCGHKPGRWD
jgi:predicted SnoaL-like aldol condensation-catalyzing enzyme